MKKVLLTAVAVLGFAFANAQSHSKGAMQVNVMGGFLTGSGTSQDDMAGSILSKNLYSFRLDIAFFNIFFIT
jgi:hypothetical protein